MARQTRETRAQRREGRAAIDDPAVVLEAAARFLESRPRSVDETRRRLLAAGYRAELVDGAVARLIELGLLDDEAFARSWIASRDRAHPRGERALRAELLRKGIDRELIAAALAERDEATATRLRATSAGEGAVGGGAVGGGAADDEAARRLLERRRPALERVADPRVRRQRAYALLARAGFDPDTAARAAMALLDDDVESG